MTQEEEKAKKAEAAPLEGTFGPQIARVLNLAFCVMSIGMCQQLANTLSHTMQGPLLDQSGIAAPGMETGFKMTAAQPSLPHIGMTAPKPFGL